MTRGFTLIELIIYSAIVATILVVASTFAWQIIQGDIKVGAYREIEQNATFGMEKITAAIRNSSKIVQPNDPGESGAFLKLNIQKEAGETPVRFEISGGKLIMKEGDAAPYPLTADLVKVTNLKFTNLSYRNTPATIRIEMTVEYSNPSGRSEYQASINLENTISLRKK